METNTFDEMGPIDYALIEWRDRQPDGSALPLLVDLVESGIIRLLDVAFLAKDESGEVASLELSSLGEDFEVFIGASTGLVGDDEFAEAARALERGTSAALLVWENRWAAPFAAAVRRNGGQLVATGRIPIQEIADALEPASAA